MDYTLARVLKPLIFPTESYYNYKRNIITSRILELQKDMYNAYKNKGNFGKKWQYKSSSTSQSHDRVNKNCV